MLSATKQTGIGTVDSEEGRYKVTLHVAHDGIEYVGRLWFTDAEADDTGFLDRGVFPGRTEKEVLDLALRLSNEELTMRCRRGKAEKRRYNGLRSLTTEVLDKIRYMNRVAESVRKGMLDVASAQQEIELTERQMIALALQVQNVAGVES